MRVGSSSTSPSVLPSNSSSVVSTVYPACSNRALRTSEKPLECTPEEGRPISTSPSVMPEPSTMAERSGHADRETGQIVLVLGIHAGHLGGLAADQAGAGLHATVGHAGDDLLQQGRVVLAAGDVVQEEQRFGALGGDIVDAHGHAVDADGVVLVGHLGHDELGAHAVGAGDQHRFAVSERGEVEQAAEPADAADHAGAFGAGPHGDLMRLTTS